MAFCATCFASYRITVNNNSVNSWLLQRDNNLLAELHAVIYMYQLYRNLRHFIIDCWLAHVEHPRFWEEESDISFPETISNALANLTCVLEMVTLIIMAVDAKQNEGCLEQLFDFKST